MLLTNRYEVSFRALLQVMLLILPFLLVVAMLFNEAGRVMSWKGFVFASSIPIMLVILLWYAESTAAFSIVSALSVYFLVFAFPRLLQLAAVPFSTSLVKEFHINELMCDNALAYLALGTVAIGIGALLGGRARIKYEVIIPDDNFKHLIFAFFLVSSNAIYWQLEKGATVLLTSASSLASDPIAVTASQLFSHHVAMIFILLVIILYKKPKWIMFAMAITYAAVTVILGSRGASMSILLMIASTLVWQGSVGFCNIRISSVLSFFLMLVVISALVFPLGTAVRDKYIRQKNGVESLEFTVESDKLAVLNRLGATQDSQIKILSLPASPDIAGKYLNITYALKSAVNVLFPGVIFEDAKISTAFLPRFLYEGADPRLLTEEYYETRPYTAWGFAFAHFGWSGGLVFLVVASAVFSFGYTLLLAWDKGVWIPILYIYSVIFSFFGMSGLDAFIVDTAKGLVHAFVFILIVKMLCFMLSMSREAAKIC